MDEKNEDGVDLTKEMAIFESRTMSKEAQDEVENIKLHSANLLRMFNKVVSLEERSEASRLMNIARTNLEQTVMWAVKAISRI